VKSTVDKVQALTNARSVEELWDIHTRLMASFGFNRMIYAFTRYFSSTNSMTSDNLSLGDPQDWVLLTNLDPSYMEGYIDLDHYANAPMVRWAVQNDGACSWRWMEEMISTDMASEKERAVFQYNQDQGVKAGYTMSFRTVSQRSKGAVALIADPDVPQYKVDQVWTEHGDELMALNNVMHLKILALPHTGSRKLTSRQREVLQWVGDGKTTQDIAILLGLTAATVEKHLRLARESLDVETTAQAVLKAAFYNQMFVMDT